MKKINIFFLFIEFIIISLSIILFLFIFFIINIYTIKQLKQIKENIFKEFYNFSGFNIEFKTITPSCPGNLKINNFKITNNKDIDLNFGDIYIEYSLINYFKNKENPFSIIKKIKINKINLFVNKDKDLKEVIDLFNKFKSNNNNNTKFDYNSLISKLQHSGIEINNINIIFLDNDLNLNIKLVKTKINFIKNINLNSEFFINYFIKNKLIGETNFFLDGFVNLDQTILSNLILNFKNIKYKDFFIKEQQFKILINNSNLTIKRLRDSVPIDFIFVKNNDDISINFNIDINKIYFKDFIKSNISDIYIPEKFFIKGIYNYNLKTKISNGDFFVDLKYLKFSLINNFEFISNFNIKNNKIKIEKLDIYSENRSGNINIEGYIPFNMDEINLFANIKDFKINNFNINGNLFINKQNKIITLSNDYLIINGIDLGWFKFNIIENKNNIYSIKTLKNLNGYNIEGDIIYKNKKFEANLVHNFNNFSISNILKIFKINYFKQYLSLNGKIINFIKDNNIIISSDSKIEINNEKELLTNFHINLLNRILEIKEIDIPKYLISGKIDIDFTQFPVNSKIILNRGDLLLNINSYISKNSVDFIINNSISGKYNFSSNFLSLIANNFKLKVKNNDLIINCNILYDIKNNLIKNNILMVENISIFKNKVGNLKLNFSFMENILKIENIEYNDGENFITGIISQNIEFKNNEIKISGNGFLKDKNKNESYSLNYKIDNNKIDSKIYVTNMNLNKFFSNSISGYTNLRLNIQGELTNPNIDFEGDISKGKLLNNDFKLLFIIRKDSNIIRIKKIIGNLGNNSLYVNDSKIELSKDNNKVFIFGSLYLGAMRKALKSDFFLTGNISQFNKNGNIFLDLFFDKVTLGFLKKNTLTKFEKLQQLKLNITKENNKIIIKNYGDKIIYSLIDKENIIIKLYNNNSPFIETFVNLNQNDLSGDILLKKFPVNFFNRILEPYVGMDGGFIDGYIKIKGNREEPFFNGRLNLYQGVVSLPAYLQEPIRNISGIIVLNNNSIFVNSVNGVVRDGLANGYGEIVFNKMKFERYFFKISSDIIPAQVKIGPIDAKGNGLIEEFIIEGKPGIYNFIATFLIENCDLTLGNFVNLNKDKNTNNNSINLPINVYFTFKAGSRININNPLINGIIEKGDKITLKYIGNENGLYLDGLVNIEKGEINYFNKTFKIEQASFQFSENDIKINPQVNIKSFYRTKDTKGNTVKIYLNITDRISNFNTSFSSIPYKSEEEIQSLLGLTMITQKDSDSSNFIVEQNFNSLMNTTNFIGNSLLFTPFENSIRRITGLDTFSMDTSLFGNIFKTNNNWIDLFENTNITLGKYISNYFYIESLMSFKKKESAKDQIFLPIPYQNYGLNFQLMLQLELPYISFGYTFLPRDYTNFLNADHRLSFEANFKF